MSVKREPKFQAPGSGSGSTALTQRTIWRYNCAVSYVTQQWTSSHENL